VLLLLMEAGLAMLVTLGELVALVLLLKFITLLTELFCVGGFVVFVALL